MILVLTEVDATGKAVAEISRQALTAGRTLAATLGTDLHACVISGDANTELQDDLGRFGVATVHVAEHDLLEEYGPETWGAALAEAIQTFSPPAVLAGATDRGAEVMAQAAAVTDLPLVANVTGFDHDLLDGEDTDWHCTRVRWGGSLLEHATVAGPVRLVTIAAHSVQAEPSEESVQLTIEPFSPALDSAWARSIVVDRIVTSTGVTLEEAPVVVGGGRGVGSAEGFAPLEELATMLGGKVGCSRVVTNNGWRPHADQVGQTGTAIAPQIYIACGISGAIQHWAGAKGARHVMAINIDPEANMVARADYAVIGDLHEVVPAIIAELRSRQT